MCLLVKLSQPWGGGSKQELSIDIRQHKKRMSDFRHIVFFCLVKSLLGERMEICA